MSHLRFHIEYHTQAGEQLVMHYTTPRGEATRLPLSTEDHNNWTCALALPAEEGEINYHYAVESAAGETLRTEGREARRIVAGQRSRLFVHDAWVERPVPAFYKHSAFTLCVFARRMALPVSGELLSCSRFLLMRAPEPPEGWRWAVSGASEHLGRWHTDHLLYLQRTGLYEWGAPLTHDDIALEATYKYVLAPEEGTPGEVQWEVGDNRRLYAPALEKGEALVITDDMPRLDVPQWRGAGVVVPVFSLRSETGWGIGDFGDLTRFLQLVYTAQLRAVQLLPINDTTSSGTWRDSYPYNGISVFALHPLYIDPREWEHTASFQTLKEEAARLNALSEVDYEGVLQLKRRFLNALYDEIGGQVMHAPAYQAFCAENTEWLQPYAAFCKQKAVLHTPDERAEGFYCFVQYLLHKQMQRAHEQARELGIILKGDIPIGVCADSVAVHTDPALFRTNASAGAPPDAFARNGQNWGFPTYNWDEMARDGYQWWKRRFAHMNRYFDAYRIDHVLGFFRIWEIPAEQVSGVMGHFRPALPLTQEEIRGFGFTLSPARFTEARLTEEQLTHVEERLGGRGLRRFFTPAEGEAGYYRLRPEYANERAACQATHDEEMQRALCDTIEEVLFLRDSDQPERYHPRIGAQSTATYAALPAAERAAFDRLHDHFFYERHNQYWADEAMKKLPAILSPEGREETMLPCAEDLGMVPSSVKGVLERLAVLSLEIERMPKAYGVRFAPPAGNPYLSVCTIATHDMPPLRLWWRENAEQTTAYWHDVLHRDGLPPEEATPEVCEQVVAAHLNSPSMLCLLAIQDLLAIDPTMRRSNPAEEQINNPANPNQYWRYRVHLTLEELIAASSFTEKLRGLVARSGRAAR